MAPGCGIIMHLVWEQSYKVVCIRWVDRDKRDWVCKTILYMLFITRCTLIYSIFSLLFNSVPRPRYSPLILLITHSLCFQTVIKMASSHPIIFAGGLDRKPPALYYSIVDWDCQTLTISNLATIAMTGKYFLVSCFFSFFPQSKIW